MTLAAGTRLGPYEIQSPLGAGGMGEVYRARDSKLKRDVAVKVLPASLANDADALARFEREAHAVAALNHPNILSIHDFGSEAGVVFAVTELLEGETLRNRIEGGSLPQRRAVEIAIQMAHGLAAAHEKAIVHRDLKPENVFLTTDGRVKILDFGLAKRVGPESAETSAPTTPAGTEPGLVMGTVGYMSPEQVRGRAVDQRTDIFAFGAILYEMLSGRRAFKGDSHVETMNAILKEEPPELSQSGKDISPALDRIIRHCLEKSPEARFHSAGDIAFDLESLTGSTGTATVSWPAMTKVPPSAPFKIAVGFVAGAVLGVWAGFRLESASRHKPNVRFQQLSFGKSSSSPSISPDGKQIVFVRREGTELDLFLQRVGGEVATNLTRDSGFDNGEPAFSADGSQIAFRSERDGGGLFVMGASGESVRKVTADGYQPTWSPDGKSLAFVTIDQPWPYSLSPGGRLDAIEISSGTRRTVLKTITGGSPAWSPHGSRIAYFDGSGPGSVRDIFTVAADGGSPPVPVTHDAPLDAWPLWSSDGRSLFFASDRNGPLELFRVAIDERSGRPSGEPEAFPLPAASIFGFSIARDGRSIAFEAAQADNQIVRFDLDPASGSVIHGPEAILSGLPLVSWLSVSHDAKRLAFTWGLITESVDVCDADGRNLNRITNDGTRNRMPRWSPDDKSIYYYSTRGGEYQLWNIGANGGEARALTAPSAGRISSCVLSSDGKKIATYINPSAANRTAAILTIGQDSLQVLKNSQQFFPYAWSPDGAVLVGYLAPHPGVCLYTLATSQTEFITKEGMRRSFSPTGDT